MHIYSWVTDRTVGHRSGRNRSDSWVPPDLVKYVSKRIGNQRKPFSKTVAAQIDREIADRIDKKSGEGLHISSPVHEGGRASSNGPPTFVKVVMGDEMCLKYVCVCLFISCLCNNLGRGVYSSRVAVTKTKNKHGSHANTSEFCRSTLFVVLALAPF